VLARGRGEPPPLRLGEPPPEVVRREREPERPEAAGEETRTRHEGQCATPRRFLVPAAASRAVLGRPPVHGRLPRPLAVGRVWRRAAARPGRRGRRPVVVGRTPAAGPGPRPGWCGCSLLPHRPQGPSRRLASPSRGRPTGAGRGPRREHGPHRRGRRGALGGGIRGRRARRARRGGRARGAGPGRGGRGSGGSRRPRRRCLRGRRRACPRGGRGGGRRGCAPAGVRGRGTRRPQRRPGVDEGTSERGRNGERGVACGPRGAGDERREHERGRDGRRDEPTSGDHPYDSPQLRPLRRRHIPYGLHRHRRLGA
jgi:hypothetical protein